MLGGVRGRRRDLFQRQIGVVTVFLLIDLRRWRIYDMRVGDVTAEGRGLRVHGGGQWGRGNTCRLAVQHRDDRFTFPAQVAVDEFGPAQLRPHLKQNYDSFFKALFNTQLVVIQ